MRIHWRADSRWKSRHSCCSSKRSIAFILALVMRNIRNIASFIVLSSVPHLNRRQRTFVCNGLAEDQLRSLVLDVASLKVQIVSLKILSPGHYSTLQSREIIFDWNLIALNHSLSVEGLSALLAVPWVILKVIFVNLDVKIARHWYRGEVVYQVYHKRPIVLLLLQKSHDEFRQFLRVAGVNGLGTFIDDWFKERLYCVFLKRWLQASHVVEGNTKRPDVTSLIVSLILDYFWG